MKSDETETLKLKGKDRPTDSETKIKNRVVVNSWSRSIEIASTKNTVPDDAPERKDNDILEYLQSLIIFGHLLAYSSSKYLGVSFNSSTKNLVTSSA